MGHTVHQVHIGLVTKAVAATGACFCRSCIFSCKYRRITADNSVNQLISLGNAIGYLAGDYLLAVETVGGHLGIDGQDDAVRICNFLCRDHVLGTGGSSCLYLDPASLGFCCLLDRFCCHVCVGNAGRAGCHGENLLSCTCRYRSRRLCGRRLFYVVLVADCKKIIRTGSGLQCLYKVVVHEKSGELSQNIQMDIVLCVGCGNQKQKIYRLSVECLIFHAIRDDHSGKSRALDCVAFSVRNRNSVADSRGSLCLTEEDLFFISLVIRNVARFFHQGDCHFQALRLVGRRSLERDALLLQKVCDFHSLYPFQLTRRHIITRKPRRRAVRILPCLSQMRRPRFHFCAPHYALL